MGFFHAQNGFVGGDLPLHLIIINQFFLVVGDLLFELVDLLCVGARRNEAAGKIPNLLRHIGGEPLQGGKHRPKQRGRRRRSAVGGRRNDNPNNQRGKDAEQNLKTLAMKETLHKNPCLPSESGPRGR